MNNPRWPGKREKSMPACVPVAHTHESSRSARGSTFYLVRSFNLGSAVSALSAACLSSQCAGYQPQETDRSC